MQARLPFVALLLVASFALVAFAQQSSQSGTSMSDREKAGLHGPVKTMRTEQTFSAPDGHELHTSTMTLYAPDGRTLEVRIQQSDGSEWVTSHTYDSNGRLLRIANGKANSAPATETNYSYDESGRMVGMNLSGDTKFPFPSQVRVQYDDKGRKSVIETYDSKPLPKDVAYGGGWEGGELGFAPYPGGSLTTQYNEEGVATGAELRDPEGKIAGKISRKFDSEGRVLAEAQSATSSPIDLPEDVRSQLSPEQIRAMSTLTAGMSNRSISYSYDSRGRVIEQRTSGGVTGEITTATTYNDNGDKATERTTTVQNPEIGRQYILTESGAVLPEGAPPQAQTPSIYETRHTYEYDAHGNWTEQTRVGRSDPEGAFGPATVVRRKITYY